jgi:hypothetical protein
VRRLTHGLCRKDNTLVLSETLDENAMQILLNLFMAAGFPKQCNEWRASKKDIADFYSRERTKRQRIALEELASREYESRRVLCHAVVGDVVGLFPCVVFLSDPSHRMLREPALTPSSLERDDLFSYLRQSHGDTNEVAGENLKVSTRLLGGSLFTRFGVTLRP